MTILEAIQKSTEFLARKGVDSPRLQSELLLAHVLKTPRLKLYLDFSKGLTDEETAALRELVQRRGTREPLQHILGSTSFCGLEVKVNRHVLVPRPETELLAEHGWNFLNALGRDSTFLDLGTGSGCIAIALCHRAQKTTGVATDYSSEALSVARENAANHTFESRIRLVASDAFIGLESSSCFDLIISNPPYIPSSEIDALQDEVRCFDPIPALDGGADGLKFYRLFATDAQKFLAPGGKLMLEFGDGQQGDLRELFSGYGWTVESIRDDLTNRPRVLVAHPA